MLKRLSGSLLVQILDMLPALVLKNIKDAYFGTLLDESATDCCADSARTSSKYDSLSYNTEH